MHRRCIGVLLLSALAVLNALSTKSIVDFVESSFASRPHPPEHYSWIEDDMPEMLPLIDPRPGVLMSFEESVHYGPDGPDARLEWLFTTATLIQDGEVYVGPTNRIAIVALSHQIHCLRMIQDNLRCDEPMAKSYFPHTEHCLSMLREQTLCAADWTLEHGDPIKRNFTLERTAGDRECIDTDAFYLTMKQNRKEWEGH